MKFKATALAAALVCAGLSAPVQAAEAGYKGFQAGDIMVRGRALAVLPNVTSSVSTIGGHVDASASFEPEIDGTYFFTPHIAAELIAAVTRHHLSDNGSSLGKVDLGSVTLLPPTLTLQYHFLPDGWVNPYLGAGVNYTVFYDKALPRETVTSISYENAWGAAIQAGADFHVQGNWFVNFDVKHIFLETKAKINGGSIIGNVRIDPTIVGLGIGYKF